MTRLAAPDGTRTLFDGALVWDAHAGFETLPGMDLGKLSKWRDAGVSHLSVNVGYDVWSWEQCIRSLAFARQWVIQASGYQLVGTAAEVEDAHVRGQLAVSFDLEGMSALDGNIDLLYLYYTMGVRQMLVAYNRNNLAGGGCHDLDVGLTSFGRRVVEEMNKIGMLVDCSHSGYRTTMEVMECSSAPVVFSHSNSWAVVQHQRNITDEQVRACAATGGVIGVNGIDAFLGGKDYARKMVDHVLHYVDLVGPEHVGIGLDYFFSPDAGLESQAGFNAVLAADTSFWPLDQYPNGKVECAPPQQLVELADGLLRRGYSDGVVRGILGQNFLRVARLVWGR